MNKNNIILVYFLLSVLIIASAVLLGKQVHHYLYEPEDPLEPFKDKEVSVTDVISQMNSVENQERQATLLLFNQTNAFRALVTPVPRPSPTPVPPPSPTPVIPGRNYILNFALNDIVSLTSYKGEQIIKKVGEVVKEEYWGDFKILKVTTAPEMSVTLQDVKTDKTRILRYGENPQQQQMPGQQIPPPVQQNK